MVLGSSQGSLKANTAPLSLFALETFVRSKHLHFRISAPKFNLSLSLREAHVAFSPKVPIILPRRPNRATRAFPMLLVGGALSPGPAEHSR